MKTIKKGLPSTLFETSNRERNKSTTKTNLMVLTIFFISLNSNEYDLISL
jgi:hypothetical protein